VSRGHTTADDGTQTPAYAPPVDRWGQVQSLQYNDIMQLAGLNIQGEKRAIYIEGQLDGLVRAENKGGDLITTRDGRVWLVVLVLEHWPDWTKVAVTLQD
jgi:hypothetical protein